MILLSGFVLSILTGLFERFIGSRLKKKQCNVIGNFETPECQAKNDIQSYFKNHQIFSGYDQVKELKQLIGESMRIIQKGEQMVVDEIET